MILGIDQSLQATGFCLIDDKGSIKKWTVVKTEDLRGPARIDYILSVLDQYIKEGGDNLVVAREGYSYGSKSSSTYEIGELGGCINYSTFLSRSGLEGGNVQIMHVIPPTTVKKFCLGSGSIKKDTAYLLKVKERFGVSFEDDNVADAYMLAYTTLQMSKIINGDVAISGLEEWEKESLIAAGIRKKQKITKAKQKKLTDKELLKWAEESFYSVYKVFGKK